MTAGSLALACVLLAVNGGADPGEDVLGYRDFEIPIIIVPDKRPDISGLELYWSRDRGQTWAMLSRISPDKTAYSCKVPADGSYWFTLVTVNSQGIRDVNDLKQAKPGLKIYVDTVVPEIKLNAERQGDEIIVNWDIREEHLDPKSLKVEWMHSGQAPILVPLTAGHHGTTRFKPTDPTAAVSIRLSVSDLAKNQNQATAMVAAQLVSPPGIVVSNDPARPVPPPVDRPPVPVAPWTSAGSSPVSADVPPAPPLPPAVLPPTGPQRVVALSSRPNMGGSTLAENGMTPVNNQLPPLQFTNKSEVKLEFEVAKYGPSGIGMVEVYVTNDDGRSWTKAEVDAKAGMLPVDARGPGPLRGSVTVQIGRDGVPYGFYLVVKNKAGFGKDPPRPGDLPQVRVELDITAPSAKLIKPEPADPSQPNSLVMRWEATDLHLAANPISLQWAPTRDGPWRSIGEPELPNTGFYVWRISSEIPASVYLRLTVRDMAGNQSVAETDKPVVVDLTVPVLSGVSLQPVGVR